MVLIVVICISNSVLNCDYFRLLILGGYDIVFYIIWCYCLSIVVGYFVVIVGKCFPRGYLQ